MRSLFEISVGDSPILATAVHNGHSLRPELLHRANLSGAERLREEDPFTGSWTDISPSHINVQVSRFEVDLNRPRQAAVYAAPEDAWGLALWTQPMTDEMQERSLMIYDRFYRVLGAVLDDLCAQYGGFVILDLHAYNHRRSGPHAEPADQRRNPDINVGTGTVPLPRFRPLIDRFIAELNGHPLGRRPLDVRENINFRGRHLAAWVHRHYGNYGCVLALEVKKIFMDEWTGELDKNTHHGIKVALHRTIPKLEKEILYETRSPFLDRIQPPG